MKKDNSVKFQRANLIVPRCFPRNERIQIMNTISIDIEKKIKGHDFGVGFALRRAIDEADKTAKKYKADAAVWIHLTDFGDKWIFDFDLIKLCKKKKQ